MLAFPNIKINLGLSITENARTDTTIWKQFSIRWLWKTHWKSVPPLTLTENSLSTNMEWK